MWIWLGLAIASEVSGTLALRASEGFTRIVPSAAMLAGYGLSMVALSRALVAGMSVGTAYAIWAGAGIALITALGWVLFGEHVGRTQLMGLVLVAVGVAALELGGSRPS